jgi:hypothetical protein
MVTSVRTASGSLLVGLLLLAFQVLAADSGMGTQTNAGGVSPTSRANGQADVELLVEAVGEFRQSGMRDFPAAIKRHATPAGARAFARINRAVWAGVDNRIAWSHFMLVSVVAVAGGDGTSSLAAYYNPWSDVFLVTQWRRDGKGLRIDDAEILLGDWIRKRGTPPLNAQPLWLRGGKHLAAAPAIAAADSIRAFEAIFARWNGKDWRSTLGGFKDPRMLAENLLFASNAMGLAIDNSVEFSADDATGDVLRLRLALGPLLGKLIAGDATAALASTTDTSAAMKKFLADFPREDFKALLPIAAFVDAEAGSVYLVPPGAPDYLIAIRFKRAGDDFHPSRIDFVSYQATYEWRQANSPDPDSGRSR